MIPAKQLTRLSLLVSTARLPLKTGGNPVAFFSHGSNIHSNKTVKKKASPSQAKDSDSSKKKETTKYSPVVYSKVLGYTDFKLPIKECSAGMEFPNQAQVELVNKGRMSITTTEDPTRFKFSMTSETFDIGGGFSGKNISCYEQTVIINQPATIFPFNKSTSSGSKFNFQRLQFSNDRSQVEVYGTHTENIKLCRAGQSVPCYERPMSSNPFGNSYTLFKVPNPENIDHLPCRPKPLDPVEPNSSCLTYKK